ncbi:glycosyltransferase [Vibrio alginolyticus]|uniref:glycosyltransferase n=1 Tax=Vibrio alginolyticus TaxID=663 RepID=UPI0023AF965B|nr:hypothetical protein [Vibrio alginolyticus]WED59382.1 hypothetical protein O6P42_16225 [Vibrio alginolyticus]
MNKNVTLVTINSEQELTGGGHYLRCLISGYEKVSGNLTIISKESTKVNFKFGRDTLFLHLKKNTISEIISRMLFCPSFLLYYFPKIIRQCKKSDIIALHSSRLGVLVFLFSFFFPKKKIFCHFDNVEYLLLKSRISKPSLSLKYVVNIWDYLLIRLSEKLCVKYSTKCSFITLSDASYFSRDGFIIPICYEEFKEKSLNPNGDYYLFTASFDFEPNIDALKDFSEIAKIHSDLKFIAAGRKLKNFNFDHIPNLTLIDSPSVDKMESLFICAKGYISSVNFGSGMKTKVAEAMKYGLPVYATDNSLIGYENVLNKSYIKNYKSLSHLSTLLNLSNDTAFDRTLICRDFAKYYTTFRVKNELERMMEC